MATKSAQEQIQEINARAKAEIAKLTAEALVELRDKHKVALATLQGIEDDIAQLTGKTPKSRRSRGGSGSGSAKADVADAKELKALLNKAEGKKLNRKGLGDAGYNLPSAIAVAKADKATFGFEQNKAQGSVWLK